MLKSSSEFVNLLHGKNYKGKLFSLDVESLFTNVPVDRTINIILEKVYNHPSIPPPAIPKNIMRELLVTCTTEVPFRNINGDMYVQRDGVSMGSPLGPTFANFFMAEVENRATTTAAPTTHKVFYMNFMNPDYKKNEAAIRKIFKDHVRTVNTNDRLQFVIYYKSTTTRDLVMKNNLTPKLRELARTNLIYDFTCSIDECKHLSTKQVRYSGLTTCTLSRGCLFICKKVPFKNTVSQRTVVPSLEMRSCR